MGNCWGTRVKAEVPLNSNSPGSGNSKSPHGSDHHMLSSVDSYPSSRTEDQILLSSKIKSFSFTELKNATRNFRPDSVLGEGGFGCVFKGWIDEHTFAATKPGLGMVIAVKKLNQDGLQGHKEWLAEVNYLGQLHHPNLVKLVGYCVEDDQRLLVYEFMPKGSLENHLFRRSHHYRPLSWALRIKVAIGAAKGLAFLHDTESKVIYRDFKASNILLDSNYNAKLSDFGLAKDGPTGDKTHVSTRVMGTYGYAAPEYVATGHLTTRSDVYSFGVVLLELLSGRRTVDKNRPPGEQNLVEWAKPSLNDKRKVYHIMDTRMEGQYSVKGAYCASKLALECLNPESNFRPHMKEVVERLEQLQNYKDMAKYPQPNRSPMNQPVNFSSRNTNHPSVGYPTPVGSRLGACQQSPRVR